MADTDVGNLKVGIGLDTSNLEKGVDRAVKGLERLDSNFDNTQKSISKSISSLSARIDDNNKAMSSFTTKTTRATRNQAIYLKKSLDNIDTSIKKSANTMMTASALIVQALNKMGAQMDITYALGQRDFAKGIKLLRKEIRHSAPQVVNQLKSIQTQTDSTLNSLGKLSKVDKLNKRFIPLDTNIPDLPTSRFAVSKVGISKDLKDATVNADSLTSSLARTWHTLSMMSFQVYLFQQGLQQVTNLVETFVAPGWEFAKSMETNEVGMAGILSSMTKLKDRELEWNEALDISRSLIKDLNYEAVRTAATSEELVGTFRALLAPGLGAGFSIDEVKKFTVVGVNAVKSMGLEGRQLVQELRDLVQGGIQSASSTLATSLGLTDKDIKEAKNSSEGLFNFLMKKLAGFKYSAQATSKTIKGLESIVTEGYVMASAEALKPVMNEYQKILVSLKDQMFDEESFTLRPEFVEGFKQVSEYSLMFLNNMAKLMKALMPIGETAMDILVPALKLVARYSDLIVTSWVAFAVGEKIKHLGTLNNELGVAMKRQYEVSNATVQATQQYNALMNTALTTGQTLIKEHNKENRAQVQRAKAGEIVKTLIKEGNTEIANSITPLYAHYKRLGLSSQEASRLQYEASQLALSGDKKRLAQFLLTTTHSLESAKATYKLSQETQNLSDKTQQLADKCLLWSNRLQGVGVALSSTGVLTKVFADESNKTAQEMADMVIRAGLVAQAFSSIAGALPTMTDGLKGLSKSIETLIIALGNLGKYGTLLQMLGAGGMGATIGAGVGALTVGAYATLNDLSKEEVQRRWDDAWDNGEERQVRIDKSVANSAKGLDDAYNQLLTEEKQKQLIVDPANIKLNENEQGHIRSHYKALEQELKTALTDIKETQKAFDHAYKYDLTSTETYVGTKFALQRKAIDAEIANLEQRKKVAQEMEQLADVANFNTQIERLGKEKEYLKLEEARQLADEYKKLDDRLFNIKKEFEGLVGVSEKAFEENTIKEYGETIVRIQTELKTANEYLNNAISSGNTEEVKLWETRKKSYQDAETRLKEIISLKKMEYDATKALAEAERVNLGLQERYLEIQGKADRLEISNLNAESQMYEERQKNLDTYIDHYTTAIAQYEAMANKATTTEQYNQYKKMALEAREELNALLNEIHPFQQAIQEEFIGSLSDMFQSMLWQEKTAKEALKDFANSVMQTFTKKVFDNFANQMASMIFPKNISDEKRNKIEETINVKIQGIDTSSLVESIFSTSQKVQQGLLPSFQALAEVTTALTNKMWELYNNIPNGGTPNGGEGNVPNGGLNFDFGNGGVGTNSEGTKPTISIGDVTLPENSLGSIDDLSSQANDATISLSSLTKSTKATTGATDENASATASDTLATATMVTTMLNATGVLGKFGTVLQGLMMAMSIAKSAGILGFADGGYISGPGTGTSDSIPARLSNGEYVVRAGAVKQLGVGFLDQLNNIDRSGVKRSSRLPKFAYAEGGYVNAETGGETQSSTPSVTGGVAQPTVVMQMTFQSLDPEANMKLMEAQYPQIRSRLIRDLQSNSSVRTAVKGVTK